MTNPTTDSILIVGTGAMACLFAARLASAGLAVTMLGTWPEGLETLQRNGVRLIHPQGSVRSYRVKATNDTAACKDARYALVLVKSWQTRRAAKLLSKCLAPDGVALTLQNGLGNREILAQALGTRRVALGIVTEGATLVGPGMVRQAGEGVVSLGSHPGLTTLAQWLGAAGFIVENAPDANVLLWGKLVINAAINPITALLRISNGELLNRQTSYTLMQATAREAASIAVAQGIRLPYPDPVVAAESVARRTAGNYSSMLQDVMRRAPTEIDAICGAIVQAGEQVDLPAPINRTLWHLVKALNPDEQ